VSKARTFALFVAVATFAAMGGAAYYLWSRSAESPRVAAERVYGARLADLKGGLQSIAQWRGQVLVVNFWATWCAPCREEIPVFVWLQERYGSRGLQFVGIAIDQQDKVAEFAREFRINYPLLIGGPDTMELMREAGNSAGVLPYTLVIDRKGNLVSRESGGLKEAKLLDIIAPLL